MLTALQVMETGPVIPVITIDKASEALPLAKALVKGGIKVLELTLRTKAAMGAITELRSKLPEAIVGAGTVLDAQQAEQAKAAGALFLVSPGSTPKVLDAAAATGLPLLPGACTPSEVMALLERGITEQKFFPAEAAGGVDMLRSIAAPIPQVKFCPTGGLTPDNASAYLALPNVVCIGGSWMVSRKLIEAKQWTEIERLARLAAALKS
ncbi:MAG TPA: bifunctional 4-hydroxy-2-oxoglutarate aldolase/2-dehydro-3-deoxy-phosphogluconate aldolase [Candidatus Acidoferrum sp.]|nr:bifunctional 4-hydroxy-2-oxoglutarate aldolase/2-dehydro-3-deoxy-phosphogluconate aldolase [Candidatus Acidoferrum sp.]